MSKEQIGKLVGIAVTMVIAVLAVFGYDVGVIQPRESSGALVVDMLGPGEAGSRGLYSTLCYRPQGGASFECDSGGSFNVNDGASLVFEGATANDFETTVAVTDPSADRTVTLPNSSGTVALNPAEGTWEFEGTTANEFETTLTVTDPTADRTVTIPNETGAVMMSSLATNATDAANAVTGASNALVFEGATANNFETSLSPADPGADATLTLPAETAALMVSSLTTNATDAANAVTGASNGLVFEGATANNFETTITPTDATADRTVTLQDASGTVALTSQAVDMTLTADATGGNAGAKTEFIGLPRIKLIAGAQGTNPASQTIALADDNPEGEYAPVDADVTEAAEAAIYKVGAGSYKATFAATATENDGFVDAGLGAAAAWDDMESAGLWLYSTVTIASGDLQLVLTDDGGARKHNIPAIATANMWTWVEVNIAASDLSAVSDVAITLTAQGETALGEFVLYFDTGYVWDSVDEEALGTAILQDGVLSVIDTEGGVTLAEYTDYIVHYESGVDFIVYITDQSGADIAVLAAY